MMKLRNERMILFVFLILLSCENQPSKDLTGSYISERKNSFSQSIGMYVLGEVYILGSNLKLKKDSTYIYTTCGNIIEGNWEIHNDSLLLFIKSNRWRNDSLNEVGFSGEHPVLKNKNKPIAFQITGDGSLLGKFKALNKNKEFILIETLVRGSISD